MHLTFIDAPTKSLLMQLIRVTTNEPQLACQAKVEELAGLDASISKEGFLFVNSTSGQELAYVSLTIS